MNRKPLPPHLAKKFFGENEVPQEEKTEWQN
jgi:hypothetical protein